MEAMDKYDIVPMQMGKILTAPFEEGDYVEKDAVLYTLDSSDAQIKIQQAQNSLAKADITNKSNLETLDDWVSTAPVSGYILSLIHILGNDATYSEYESAASKVIIYIASEVTNARYHFCSWRAINSCSSARNPITSSNMVDFINEKVSFAASFIISLNSS